MEEETIVFKELVNGEFILSIRVYSQSIIIRCHDEKSADKLSRSLSDNAKTFAISRKR